MTFFEWYNAVCVQINARSACLFEAPHDKSQMVGNPYLIALRQRLPVICPETYKSRFSRDRGVAEMLGKDTGAASANEQTSRIEVLQLGSQPRRGARE
jgi:hypothetical protein